MPQTRIESEISYEEAKRILRENPNSILMDVRSIQEYREYHLPRAINLPLYDITTSSLQSRVNNRKTSIILYCATGHRSKEALIKLRKLEYPNVYMIKSGLEGIE